MRIESIKHGYIKITNPDKASIEILTKAQNDKPDYIREEDGIWFYKFTEFQLLAELLLGEING